MYAIPKNLKSTKIPGILVLPPDETLHKKRFYNLERIIQQRSEDYSSEKFISKPEEVNSQGKSDKSDKSPHIIKINAYQIGKETKLNPHEKEPKNNLLSPREKEPRISPREKESKISSSCTREKESRSSLLSPHEKETKASLREKESKISPRGKEIKPDLSENESETNIGKKPHKHHNVDKGDPIKDKLTKIHKPDDNPKNERDVIVTLRDNRSDDIDEIYRTPPTIKRLNHFPSVRCIYANNLDITIVKPRRAGVIIYTEINNKIYFGMGLDTMTHDLTDFGGGVMYNKDGDALSGALREFHEETLEIFDKITTADIQRCLVIHDANNLIVFIHMDVDPETVCAVFNDAFSKMLAKKFYAEVCGITWLSWEEMQWSIKNSGIMYSKVKNLLLNAGDFIQYL